MIHVSHARRPARRAGLLAATVLTVGLLVPLFGASPAGAGATDCVKAPGSFARFTATFSNGSMKLGSATGEGLGAKACGSITTSNGQFISTVQPADMAFDPVSVKVLFLKLPAKITVNAPVTGPAKIGPGFTSADISLSASITAGASLLGFTCNIGPIVPTLTTGTSGALTGKTFTGSLKDGFSGTVVANDFPVPGIQKSPTCPGFVAFLANALVGLPAAPGKASIQMDGTIKIG